MGMASSLMGLGKMRHEFYNTGRGRGERKMSGISELKLGKLHGRRIVLRRGDFSGEARSSWLRHILGDDDIGVEWRGDSVILRRNKKTAMRAGTYCLAAKIPGATKRPGLQKAN